MHACTNACTNAHKPSCTLAFSTKWLYLPGNYECNVTEPHTVINGSKITYSCQFIYRGFKVADMNWNGPGTAGAKTNSHVTRSPQPLYKDCYEGKQQVIYINIPTVNRVGTFCHLATNFDFLRRHACKTALFTQ